MKIKLSIVLGGLLRGIREFCDGDVENTEVLKYLLNVENVLKLTWPDGFFVVLEVFCFKE